MAIVGQKRDGDALDGGGYDEDFPQFKKPRNELVVADDTTSRERRMALSVSFIKSSGSVERSKVCT